MSLLSLTGKLWKIARPDPHGTEIVDLLRRERSISDDPTGTLFDPFLFPEMQRAVNRIETAMQAGETIAVFGDYDADGITATAQLVRFFERHGITVLTHLPDRVKEGYGMRKESIDLLKEKGVNLIITVDTGISAHDEIAHARSLGIDVIVTDHHRQKGGRPDAFAVIHPLIPSPSPNPHLCGSGVAFMLVRALEHGQPWQGIEIDIALATIGTIGDLVSLTGENRLLVQHGLSCLQDLPPSPLRALVESVRGSVAVLSSTDVAFKIVPRLNAAGRMAHPDIALQALIRGGEALEKLHQLNSDRQTFVSDLHARMEGSIDPLHTFLVVAHEEITPGTAGLLASRFTERFSRPSLVAAMLGDKAVASVRSVVGIDLMEHLSHPSVASLLTSFGGHAQAAGCTFPPSNIDALRQALITRLRDSGVTLDTLQPFLEIDAVLHPSAVTLPFASSITSLSPFGQGNEEPVFLFRGLTLVDPRVVGADGAHLQCTIGGTKAIGFRLGPLLPSLESGKRYDTVARIGKNAWNGKETVQLFIEDIGTA